MSYCRFSSDYFDCDLYVYEDFTGSYCIHVAGSRYVFDRTPIVPTKTVHDFVKNHMYVMEALKTAKSENIELPYAGESFYVSEFNDAIEKVKELKELGYIVPSYVIPDMEEELSLLK